MPGIAIIPARGGSKGVLKKNMRTVDGVPLVERAIAAAKMAHEVTDVFVSTDSHEIADLSKRLGAKVVLRPEELAQDDSSSESALLHTLNTLSYSGVTAFIQCTSPFIRPEDLDEGIRKVETGVADSVFSAVEDHGFRWADQGDHWKPIGHQASSRPRRQDLPSQCRETGAFYVFSAQGLRDSNSRFHGRIDCVQVPKWSSIEIDEEEDLQLANAVSHMHALVPMNWREDIGAIIFDFDGVQTDDFFWLDENGRESVRLSRSDGQGFKLLRENGKRVLILSTERNAVVSMRAAKLGVEVIHGVESKGQALQKWASQNQVSLQRIMYVGNELNDFEAMTIVGFPVSVKDAHPKIKSISKKHLRSRGGHKVVREVANFFEEGRG